MVLAGSDTARLRVAGRVALAQAGGPHLAGGEALVSGPFTFSLAYLSSKAAGHCCVNVQATHTIKQIEQATVIHRDVVALHAVQTLRNIGHEVRHFLHRVRIGHVDNAQTVGKPRHRDLGAGHFFAGLMAT